MADARELRYSIGFDTGDAASEVDKLTGRVSDLERRMGAVEMGAQQMGSGAVSACNAGAQSAAAFAEQAGTLGDSLNGASDSAQTAASTAQQFGRGLSDVGDEAEALRGQLREIAEGASDMGEAFRDTMSAGLEAGQSITKSFKTGLSGAIDFAGKKVKTWAKDFQTNIKTINTQFQHPIQTIKTKLVEALQDAQDATDDAGSAADKASGDFGEMGAEGAKAGNDVSEALKDAAKALLSFEAIKQVTQKLIEFGKAAVSAFTESETVGAKFNAIFTDDAANWATNFAKETHRSTKEVKDFMVQNNVMYQKLGLTGDAAEFLSEMTTSLAYDFGNAFQMDDAEALGKIQEAIEGNSDALLDFGINLDESALAESARAMGLDDNIETMDEATKAQVTLNSILSQSSDIQRAAVEQTDGLTNATKSLKGSVDEFLTGAGEKMAPTLEGIVGAVVDKWPDIESTGNEVLDALAEGFDGFDEDLGTFIDDTLPSLGDAFSPVAENVGPLADAILNLTGTALPPLSEAFGEIVESTLPPIVDALNNLNDSVLSPLMDAFNEVAETVLPPLEEAFGSVMDVVGELADEVMPPLSEVFDTLMQAAKPVFDALSDAAQSIFPALNPLVEALGNFFSNVVAPAFEKVSPLLTAIGEGLGTVIGWISELISWVAGGVGKVINFFSGLFGGASASEEEVEDLTSTVEELSNMELEDKSLAVDTSEYTSGVSEAAAAAETSVSDATSAAAESASENLETISTSAEETFEGVSDASTEAQELTSENYATILADAQTAYDGIESASSDAATAVSADFDRMESEAKNAYTAAENAAESSWSSMIRSASNGANSIVESFQRIERAAREANQASLSVSGGGIPGHAEGTPNFEGGWTRMNEEGGELAFLPHGTAIIPADKTDEIINNSTGGSSSSYTDSSTFSPQISVTMGGSADPIAGADISQQIRAMLEQFWREKKEEEYRTRALQGAYARM